MSETSGRSVRIVPPAEIDVGSAFRLSTAISDAYAAGAELVTVDFADVRFCDSTGLRVLVEAAKLARSLGRRFAIAHPTARLLRLAEIVGASDVLGLPLPGDWP